MVTPPTSLTPITAITAITTQDDPVPGSGPTDQVEIEMAAPTEQGEIEMAARLRVAVTRLHRRLRQHSAGGLTQSQASALTSIGQLGSPTLGELAARESVQPPSMTRIVAALEETGYVSRLPDPGDRRVARVTLTGKGDAVLRRSRSRKNAYLAAQLQRLAPEDRDALAALTVLLERLASLEEP